MLVFSILFFYLTLQSNGNIIEKFTESFNNDKIIKKWRFFRYTKNTKNVTAKNIMRYVTLKIKDVLINIKTEEYKFLKILISDIEIKSFKKISFFYFESFLIIRSIKRILQIYANDQIIGFHVTSFQMTQIHRRMIKNSTYKLKFPYHRSFLVFYKKVILFEYACIYNDIMDVLYIILYHYISSYFLHQGEYDFIFDFDHKYEMMVSERTNKILQYARNLINKVIEVDKEQPISILTSLDGITQSVKCSSLFTEIYKSDEYELIDSDSDIRELDKNETKHENKKRLKIDFLLDKISVYNRSSMKIYIVLIHFLSIQNNEEYKIEFSLIKNDSYQVKVSRYNVTEALKSYYLKKELKDDCNVKTIDKFFSIINFDKQYSIKKSIDTKDKSLETRVIKLSCGHLLGLELIDEWFKMFPYLKCHICMHDINILGSFNTYVYECK